MSLGAGTVQSSARMLALSLLLVRAAVFLWIKPLPIAASITGSAALNSVAASALSPANTACLVFFTVVRMRDRAPALR